MRLIVTAKHVIPVRNVVLKPPRDIDDGLF
jgi:hypothetical protein